MTDRTTEVPRGPAIGGAVALVTGAGAGIGAALAAELVVRGAAVVVLADLDADAATETCERILASHAASGSVRPPVLVPVDLDVADAHALRGLVARIESEHGRLDVVCSNAGIGTGAGVEAPSRSGSGLGREPHGARACGGRRAARDAPAGTRSVPAHVLRGGLLTVAGDAPYAVTKHAAVALAEWLAMTYGGPRHHRHGALPARCGDRDAGIGGPARDALRPGDRTGPHAEEVAAQRSTRSRPGRCSRCRIPRSSAWSRRASPTGAAGWPGSARRSRTSVVGRSIERTPTSSPPRAATPRMEHR
jgi:NAD(P)-dependent dehydrogenase (short-subunit alcohol dehydrogenase family)